MQKSMVTSLFNCINHFSLKEIRGFSAVSLDHLYSSNQSSGGADLLKIVKCKCLLLQILSLLSKLLVYWFPSNSLRAFAP